MKFHIVLLCAAIASAAAIQPMAQTWRPLFLPGSCTCADPAPCRNQNDGSCSQRIDPMGKPVASGGQCSAGTDDCDAAMCSCTSDTAPCMNLNDRSCMSRTDVTGKPDVSGTCTPGTKDCLKSEALNAKATCGASCSGDADCSGACGYCTTDGGPWVCGNNYGKRVATAARTTLRGRKQVLV